LTFYHYYAIIVKRKIVNNRSGISALNSAWRIIVMKFNLNYLKPKAYLIAAFITIGGLAGSSYFGYKLVHSQSIPAPVNSVAVAPQTTPISYSASQPVSLIIPKIGVDAPSVNLNLKADGTLETPNSPTEVGWYRNSPTPGEIGPSGACIICNQ
jgi:hypothetical protein